MKSEYIDKKILMNDIGMAQGCKMSCADCEKINCNIGEVLDRQPTIELEPVHGEWKPCFEDNRKQIEGNECTVCKFRIYGSRMDMFRYCPNCGAKMEEET